MCSRSSCPSCAKVDECGWCATSKAVAVGDCISASEAGECSTTLVTETGQCPSVGGDVILKNITGMLGAMIGVAILLNVYNRVSNRRRRKKLQHSIFELPVYVYTAPTSKRAKAARQARLQVQGEEAASSDPMHNAEVGGSAPAASLSSSTSSRSSSSSEDGDEASVVTCTVCLSAYEEEEVIKVLPCGHEFHSGCLDSWLEQKATCPLCMAPAFTKLRDQDRTSHAQASIQGLRQADAAPPLLTSSDQVQRVQLGGASLGAGVDGGLLLARPASPPPPETKGDTGVDDSLPPSEARPGETVETARREEEVATPVPAMAMTMAVKEEDEGVQKDGSVSDETATPRSCAEDNNRPLTSGAASAPIGSAIAAGARIYVGAGGGGALPGAGKSVAGDGGGEARASVTHPSEQSSPYQGGIPTESAKPRSATPERADRELSLTELEKGHAGPTKATIVAGVAVDAAGVVPDGGLAAGYDESGLAAGGGVDIEGGGSGVDGSVNELAAAFQA